MTLSSTNPDVLRVTDRFVFFWKPPSPFGQWTPSRFSVDGVPYTCAEQFMMAEKARLFGDNMVLAQILATDDPRAHKRLGRKVGNFSEDAWNQNREDIVYRGNMAKFGQDDGLRDLLMETGDRTLVEASPYDRIWGIGLKSTDADAEDPARWQGLNLLGKVLMRVRSDLR